MTEGTEYTITGGIRCNNIVEDAKELVTYKLEMATCGSFKLRNEDAAKILNALNATVLKAAIGNGQEE